MFFFIWCDFRLFYLKKCQNSKRRQRFYYLLNSHLKSLVSYIILFHWTHHPTGLLTYGNALGPDGETYFTAYLWSWYSHRPADKKGTKFTWWRLLLHFTCKETGSDKYELNELSFESTIWSQSVYFFYQAYCQKMWDIKSV